LFNQYIYTNGINSKNTDINKKNIENKHITKKTKLKIFIMKKTFFCFLRNIESSSTSFKHHLQVKIKSFLGEDGIYELYFAL